MPSRRKVPVPRVDRTKAINDTLIHASSVLSNLARIRHQATRKGHGGTLLTDKSNHDILASLDRDCSLAPGHGGEHDRIDRRFPTGDVIGAATKFTVVGVLKQLNMSVTSMVNRLTKELQDMQNKKSCPETLPIS
jgi:hypothetical protein